jgi:hypothetical protein
MGQSEDEELQREIRAGRTFSMAEAIGRLAGSGGMKGGSPVAGRQEAAAAIGDHIRMHLPDVPGALKAVLQRDVAASPLLLRNHDQPLVTLAEHLRQLLASEALLADLVRTTDMEWGQVMGERPYFEREGAPAHPADPYTTESVRRALSRLLESLGGSGASST